jgi:hypothetical protein
MIRWLHVVTGVVCYLSRQRLRWLVCTACLARLSFVNAYPNIRLMRRTGKLYTLTMVSCGMGVTASLLASCWSENSSTFHLWIDLIPQGFGMASFITTTLIVSPSICAARRNIDSQHFRP